MLSSSLIDIVNAIQHRSAGKHGSGANIFINSSMVEIAKYLMDIDFCKNGYQNINYTLSLVFRLISN